MKSTDAEFVKKVVTGETKGKVSVDQAVKLLTEEVEKNGRKGRKPKAEPVAVVE